MKEEEHVGHAIVLTCDAKYGTVRSEPSTFASQVHCTAIGCCGPGSPSSPLSFPLTVFPTWDEDG